MGKKLTDRTGEWQKQQQILKEYANRRSLDRTTTDEGTDKKQN
ncbi:hypothetical protein SRRS_15760 [Sporomusa rhizae]